MFLNKKGSSRASALIKLVAVFMSVAAICLLTGAVTDFQSKSVTLVMVDAFSGTEETEELTTRQNTVSEFLEENDIVPDKFDRLSMLPEDELYSGARIIIRKGRTFTLDIDGNIEIITTTKKTIREAFEEAGVSLGENDRVEPELDNVVEDSMTVKVFRVARYEVTVDTEIAYSGREVSDPTLEKGKTKIKTKGINGLKRSVYAVTSENGTEVKRELISEVTVKQPTAQVVAVGTGTAKKKTTASQGTKKASSSGQSGTKSNLSYSKKLTVTATAYTAPEGKKTASGRTAQYGVVAVDPDVIPLGTKLYIESTDDGKSWHYGYCVAGDVGGAVKGNKVDLYYSSKNQCLQFGRRTAIVYVLD